MNLNKKLLDFFELNKDKSKNEVVELMMKEFGYKKSTAISRYSDYGHKCTSSKAIVFDFFRNNLFVLDELDNKTYANRLGIPIATYSVYKYEYKAFKEKENRKPPKYGEKYYKGRLREKFTFNDNKLFE